MGARSPRWCNAASGTRRQPGVDGPPCWALLALVRVLRRPPQRVLGAGPYFERAPVLRLLRLLRAQPPVLRLLRPSRPVLRLLRAQPRAEAGYGGAAAGALPGTPPAPRAAGRVIHARPRAESRIRIRRRLRRPSARVGRRAQSARV